MYSFFGLENVIFIDFPEITFHQIFSLIGSFKLFGGTFDYIINNSIDSLHEPVCVKQ